jgi:hypothetical protein
MFDHLFNQSPRLAADVVAEVFGIDHEQPDFPGCQAIHVQRYFMPQMPRDRHVAQTMPTEVLEPQGRTRAR